jgi:hypothetical protein
MARDEHLSTPQTACLKTLGPRPKRCIVCSELSRYLHLTCEEAGSHGGWNETTAWEDKVVFFRTVHQGTLVGVSTYTDSYRQLGEPTSVLTAHVTFANLSVVSRKFFHGVQ